MIATIISSCISGVVAIITCVIANRKSTTLMQYKLEKLTEEVRMFNNVKFRTYELEKDAAVTKEQIKIINHRIGGLENEKKVNK